MNKVKVKGENDLSYCKLAVFEPRISSENIGDNIIQEHCTSILKDIFGGSMFISMPTRSKLTKPNYRHIKSSNYSFVCGTNLLASNMRKRKQWNINLRDTFYVNNAVLFGVGWWQYQQLPDMYTRLLLTRVLSDSLLHSVRDSYTEKQLRAAGMNNVINTACPTMWGLTPEFCKTIPQTKAKNVVTTLTNYNKNPNSDQAFLNTLLNNYEKVYVWLQAIEDYSYTKSIIKHPRLHFVGPTLSEYDVLLNHNDIEYVGTRLHGGIRALNKGKRSIILAVDNRATEIAKDTNLVVLQRNDAPVTIESIINSKFETKIKLPVENIKKWKSQFII